MDRFLLIDIGAGTMDLLCIDRTADLHYKLVAKSPVVSLAETVDRCPGNLLITGVEMGGGRFSQSLKKRAQNARVVMTESASATVHHDLEKVRSFGIEIVDDATTEDYLQRKDFSTINAGDLDIGHLENLVTALGVFFEFDAVGVCAQDHGMPPDGVSHLDFRHHIFKAALDKNPLPEALLYRWDEVPAVFNRLNALAQTARRLPADAVYVMDSGMAAILGASLDSRARDKQHIVGIDVATSHTVCAALEHGRLAGFFEYHTNDMTPAHLESLVPALADGKINHAQILKAGGHGAYLRDAFGYHNVQIIIVTGPRRDLVRASKLPLVLGAPMGDNMMTGTAGLLEAICRRNGLEPVVTE